ncbi:BamA/OMP85 family outer membrane protein [Selenomonas sp. KH1T6]|uniref:BamA/OMP85 family outer membrane protein n=1 Tax=Selenomonas sp. KH1T6 TaxID=3158784 RepID=UPI0008A770C2|nr:Beta-barrel assembly machine subunit BamA [Selenomonas ruminantium]
MKKKRYRYLAAAVAMATSAAVLPGYAYAAEEVAAQQETVPAEGSVQADNVAADMAAVSPEEAVETKAADGAENETAATEESAQAPVQVDERTENWNKNRPDEKAIEDLLGQFEGQTIVDIRFEGATEKTEPTAKAAVSMHAGDMFTSKLLYEARDTIYNTGYFYDIFPSFEKVPEGVIVTFHVLENPVLTDIEITGNTVEKSEELYDRMGVKKGEILNSRILHENIQAIQELYHKDGYILMKVSDMNIDPSGKLVIKINEGKLEGYAVKGNKKTKDRVILREMRQKPGEPFNSKLARRSVQRVYNLGFFEDVNIKMNPGVEPNAVIMEVDVKEQRTGTFGVGAGYSSSDGILGMINVGDKNFLGTGDAVTLTYQRSGSESDAQGFLFSYRRPWIDKKETVGTLKIYNRTYEYSDYDTSGDEKESYMRRYAGGEITFGRPVSEYSTNYLTLRNRKDTYVRHEDDGNVVWTNPDGSIHWGYHDEAWKKYNFGTTRSITFQHVTDTRDNVYNPTEGGKVSLTAEVAGFGGDFDFQKASIEDARYFKVGHNRVIAVRGMLGYGHGHLSEFNQYRVGGQDTLRGYRDDQFRGDRMALLSIEYRFPLVDKVQGAVFADGGGAWSDRFLPHSNELHASVGVGISFNTPIGPVRLDYGRGDQGGRVHFTVGGAF